MSIHLTGQAEQQLASVVSTASTTFGIAQPGIATEVLDGPDSSALHIKVTVDAIDERFVRPLSSAIVDAALAALPELGVPFVTIFRRRARP
jgi:hypothetical protein